MHTSGHRYWYNNYCLFPDMATVFIAIDKASTENGCLKVGLAWSAPLSPSSNLLSLGGAGYIRLAHMLFIDHVFTVCAIDSEGFSQSRTHCP